MTVLYLSYDGMTDPLGQSQVLPYLEGLSRKGYTIHLVSFEKPDKFQQLEITIRSICSKAGIIWHPLPYSKNPPVIGTLYDLFKMRNKSVQLHREFGFNLVHCRSYLPAMIGAFLQKKFKTKFLFDIRGFWADERVEGNIWRLSNPVFNLIYQYMKRQEKKLFCEADAVISLTEKAIPIIRNIQSASAQKKPLYVIPCCVDTNLFNFSNIEIEESRSIRNQLGVKEDAFVLSYLGGISTWYLPSEMLDFYKRLLLRFPTCVFLFITQEEREVIFQLAKSKSISEKNIVVISAQRKDVPAYLSISNASLFFIKPSFSKQASSPTKQGEIMSMGIPIISNKGIGDTDEILLKSGSGVICDDFSDTTFDALIHQLEIHISAEKKEKIRESAIHYFSLENGIELYTNVYRKLLNQE